MNHRLPLFRTACLWIVVLGTCLWGSSSLAAQSGAGEPEETSIRPKVSTGQPGLPGSGPLTSSLLSSSILQGKVPDLDPLRVTAEMRAFLDQHIDDAMQRETRLRKLQEAIFDPKEGLGIDYGTHGTYTAAETFERAEGNCLSFTLLFVSLARELGFNVHFIEVDEVTGWSRRGEVSFNHWHMFAEVEMANGMVQVDFLPWEERRYRARQRIDESRMRAHFYNNLGAQYLTTRESSGDSGRDSAAAAAYFKKALELDPSFIPARINLAVAERRSKLFDRAEANLKAVLEQEPKNFQAATNLANLYAFQGRDEEAEKWAKRRERFLRQNPFHHFRLGMGALAAEDAEAARTHFRRAITRQVDEAIFHEQLAEAQFRLGEHRKARLSLERALEYCEPTRTEVIEGKLKRLAELTSATSGRS